MNASAVDSVPARDPRLDRRRAMLKRRARAWGHMAQSAAMARIKPDWVPRTHAGHLIVTFKCNLTFFSVLILRPITLDLMIGLLLNIGPLFSITAGRVSTAAQLIALRLRIRMIALRLHVLW